HSYDPTDAGVHHPPVAAVRVEEAESVARQELDRPARRVGNGVQHGIRSVMEHPPGLRRLRDEGVDALGRSVVAATRPVAIPVLSVDMPTGRIEVNPTTPGKNAVPPTFCGIPLQPRVLTGRRCIRPVRVPG